jgi:hypothetical protein
MIRIHIFPGNQKPLKALLSNPDQNFRLAPHRAVSGIATADVPGRFRFLLQIAYVDFPALNFSYPALRD